MTTALIDGDILIYEAASICERTIAWPYGDDGETKLYTRHAHYDEAYARLMDSIETITKKAKADDAILALTDGRNWRFDFYGDYKSNRKASVKPMLVPILRDALAALPNGRRIPTLEGDDVMGILQTRKGNADTICVTIDKDLKTIPGRHYNYRKDEFFEVTVAEANRWHLLQTLTGDTTDGYPGCRGIGAKKAENLIPDPVEDKDVLAVWNEVIVPAYAKYGFDEPFALGQARVARILRSSDFNMKTKKVIPWTPQASPTKSQNGSKPSRSSSTSEKVA
jgi:DNA polymerase-1